MEKVTIKPIASVIILTYNQEETIARAIDSVLNQDCSFPYEIIIGEDCSNDATSEICEMYARNNPDKIKLFANKINKGLLDNYYDCILASEGKYIADCAGDDYWIDPLKLEKQIRILESHPEVSLVHASWNYDDKYTSRIYEPLPPAGFFKYRHPIIEGYKLIVPFISGNERPIPLVHLSTALFRKDIFLESYNKNVALYRNKDYKCEDVPVIVAMMAAGKIAFIPDKVLNYSIGHSSISSGEDCNKSFDFYCGVLCLKLKLIEIYGTYEVLMIRSFHNSVHYLLALAFQSQSEERMLKIKEIIKKNRIKLRWKGWFYILMSKNKLTWKCSKLFLNKIVSSGKRSN